MIYYEMKWSRGFFFFPAGKADALRECDGNSLIFIGYPSQQQSQLLLDVL